MNPYTSPLSLTRDKVYSPPSPMENPSEPEKIIHNGTSILQFPDGTAVVGPDEDEQAIYPERMPSNHHNENLALFIDTNELSDIGNSLKQSIEEDRGSQEQFFEAVATAIEYLGLTITSESDKEDLPFKGAASVYSSAMFESILDSIAAARNSIFKSSGMVDTVIMGEASDELQNIALRKKDFFNYYFDVAYPEFRKEAIRTVFWAYLSGSIYKKVYICPVLNRPVSNFIPLEDLIVNRQHSSHLSATRKTHILRISEREYDMRLMMGLYRDTEIMKEDERGEGTEVIQEQLDMISGYEPTRSNMNDAGYVIYECHVEYRIKSDPKAKDYNISLPYIISIDQKSGKVLSIYRNWDENDFLKTKKEFFVNYSMLPSLDGEGYGYVNYAGRLSEAATSLTRQLLNSATYANFPGGVYAAGIRIENNNLRPAPGEFVPIQTGGLPVSQAIQALPYKEPSNALQTLKDQLEDNIRKPSAIVNQKVAEMAPHAPMGSVLAMLENLQKVPNAILQNLHESFTRELGLFNDRFAEWLPADEPYPFVVPGGQHVIMKKDFDSDIKVIPSSDPTTKNSAHRLMLSEIVLDKATKFPDLHNLQFAFKYFYKNLGLSEEDSEQLLSPKKDTVAPAQSMDPVSTIMALTNGQPTTAAVWQDHGAYIAIIDTWMQTNPQNPHLQAAASLKQQHEAYKYMVDTYAQLNMAPPEDPSQLPPDQQNNLAVAIAHIKLEEQKKMIAQSTPPEPPLDPAKVELEAAHLQAQMSHEKHELEFKRIELDTKKMEMDYALKEQEFGLKMQIEHLKQEMDQKKSELDFFKVAHEQALKERDQAMKERDVMEEERIHNDENIQNEAMDIPPQ